MAKKITSTVKEAVAESLEARRPSDNPNAPAEMIERFNKDLNRMKGELEDYSVHLRSLDRIRLNGVGIKKQGFIELAYQIAVENPEFLPHYLTIEKFRADGEYFLGFKSLVTLTDQIRELMWNVSTLSSKVWYSDSLEYYSSVNDAAKRGIDPAETLYKAMEPFFGRPSRKKGKDGKPALTEKKLERDVKAIETGKKDGIVMIENENPKLEGGVHKVIDEGVGE